MAQITMVQCDLCGGKCDAISPTFTLRPSRKTSITSDLCGTCFYSLKRLFDKKYEGKNIMDRFLTIADEVKDYRRVND